MSRQEEVVSMEETRKRKTVLTTKSGEASVAGDQQSEIAPEEHEKISIVVHETSTTSPQKTITLEERFKSITEAKPVGSETPEQFIHRVPLRMRDTKDYHKYFEPRVVSVGPYHHGKVKLMPAEPIKLLTVKNFIEKNQQNVERLYNLISNEIKSLRKCYDDKLTEKYKDEELAWMLFVDGCCVLHYIECFTTPKLNELDIKDHEIAFVQQDLFLLENQLPFRVLELLMGEIPIFQAEKGKQMIDKFMRMLRSSETGKGARRLLSWLKFPSKLCSWLKLITSKTADPNKQKMKKEPEPEPEPAVFSHLLERLRREYVDTEGNIDPSKKEKEKQNKTEDDSNQVTCVRLFRRVSELTAKCCKFLWPCDSKQGTDGWHSFRSVSELKAKGIHITPSKSKLVTDVKFNRKCFAGHLTLPKITIDDSTKSKLLNLIALEMCLDRKSSHHYEVTSYVCFLDELIDDPKDVGELRDAGILYNMLGADQEVSTLFNEIATDLVPNSAIYEKIKSEIQKHCENKFSRWVAQGLHTHFDSPWTVLAFLAAISALSLSVVQTYYAIKAASNECDGLCEYLKKALHVRK